MKYRDYKLANNAQDVLSAFCSHPGRGQLRPFGLDIHGGFEFFYCAAERRFYRKGAGTMTLLPVSYEDDLVHYIAEGTIELYLRRPSAGIRTDLIREKELLHAATGQPIPRYPTGCCTVAA